MNQEEFYRKTLMPVGWHFKFCGDECVVDERGLLIVRDYMFGDWILPRYETRQTEYAVRNRAEIVPLRLKAFHYRRFSENGYTFEKQEKNRAYDRMLEIVCIDPRKENPELEAEFDKLWEIALR